MGLHCDYLVVITNPTLIFEREKPVKPNWLYLDCYYHSTELSINETEKYLKKTAIQEFKRRCKLYKAKHKESLENKKLLVTFGYIATYQPLLCIIYQSLFKTISKII